MAVLPGARRVVCHLHQSDVSILFSIDKPEISIDQSLPTWTPELRCVRVSVSKGNSAAAWSRVALACHRHLGRNSIGVKT